MYAVYIFIYIYIGMLVFYFGIEAFYENDMVLFLIILNFIFMIMLFGIVSLVNLF